MASEGNSAKRRRMGTVYKRGNVWWIKYHRNGRPYFESSRSRKKMVAENLLKQRLGDIAQGKLPGIHYDRVTFKDLAEDYILDYRVNGKKTVRKAETLVRLHLEPFFGGMSAPQISTPLIRQYTENRMNAGATNATINRELAALKRMFNLDARSTPPKVAQVPYIPMLAEDNVRQGFFEVHEFLALRNALPSHLRGPVTLAYKSGWRFSEIMGLTWNQIDREQGIVRLEVGETKNKSGRTFYMDDEIRDLVNRQFSDRRIGCPFVFHRAGRRIVDFRDAWSKACKEAGIGKKLFHDFRRTAVRNMVRAGIPERVAMTISGHKTRSVFDRYDIVSGGDLKMASAKMEAYLKAQTVTDTVTVPDLPTRKGFSHVS